MQSLGDLVSAVRDPLCLLRMLWRECDGKLPILALHALMNNKLFRCVLTELRVDETTQSPWRTDTLQSILLAVWFCKVHLLT